MYRIVRSLTNRLDTVSKLKAYLKKVEMELYTNDHLFSEVYLFSFDFSLEGEERGLGKLGLSEMTSFRD